MRTAHYVQAFILLLCSHSSHALVPQYADLAALQPQLQQHLDQWQQQAQFPGATFAVCLKSGQCLSLATGYADTEQQRKMRPSDLMPAGSTGKTLAMAVAMQLVTEGKLELDKKVQQYLHSEEWFQRLPNADSMTVRQLLNHSSGLVRYEYKAEFTDALTLDPDKIWQPEQLLSFLFDTEAKFAAGQGWDYSDSNYIVLGVILEKITGQKFYQLAQTRLLNPLQLTQIKPQDQRYLPGVVQGYAGEKNAFGKQNRMFKDGRMIINPQFEWTGGGFIATSEQLARWAQAMYRGRAFDAALLPEVLQALPAPLLGKTTGYGLGVIVRQTPFGQGYGHSGFFPGYMTDMMYLADSGLSLSVQVNTSVPERLGGKSLNTVLIDMASQLLTSTQAKPQ